MDMIPPQITLYGRPTVRVGAAKTDRLGVGKGAPLLCLVALAGWHGRDREELADLLWPDADTLTGRNRLKQALAVLRRALSDAGIDPDQVLASDRRRIALQSGVTVDVAHFLHCLRVAARAEGPQGRADALAEAVRWSDAPLCAGLSDEPLLLERERLRQLRLAALERLADARESLDDADGAIEASRQLLRDDPIHEGGCRRLLRLLTGAGRRTEAVRALAEYAARLDELLGMAPSPQLHALLAADPAPRPEIVAPPVPLTQLFGRGAELDALAALLDPERGERLLTLTGPAGMGKTRLAAAALERLAPRYGRTAFVPLAEVREPDRIADACARALGVAEGALADLPTPTLLVLDNLEQMTEVGGPVAIERLLRASPRLTVLATSRHRLRLQIEREFLMRPLAPDDGVALFLDRARRARADLSLTSAGAAAVSALCERLDGLPLAIELAASRCGVLSPQQLLERLSARFDLLVDRSADRAGRHRSLRTALDGSWGLLGVDERRFFVHLSAFRGGFDLASAEAVTGEALAVDLIALLRDRSFVAAEEVDGGMRFHLLETLREYAAEKLDPAQCAPLRRRHAERFLALAEAQRPFLDGPGMPQALRLFDRERENLTAALDWAQEADLEIALRLCTAMSAYWDVRGLLREARARAEAALASPDVDRFPDLVAGVANIIGISAVRQGDMATARPYLERTLAIRRAGGDEALVARALHNLGYVLAASQESEAAKRLYEETLDIHCRHGDRTGEATVRINLGLLQGKMGRYEEACACFEVAIALLSGGGNPHTEAIACGNLGSALQRLRRFPEATVAYRKGLELSRKLGAHTVSVMAIGALGMIACEQGDLVRGVHLSAAFQALCQQLGVTFVEMAADESPALVRAAAEAVLGQAEVARLWEEGAALTLDQAETLAAGYDLVTEGA